MLSARQGTCQTLVHNAERLGYNNAAKYFGNEEGKKKKESSKSG